MKLVSKFALVMMGVSLLASDAFAGPKNNGKGGKGGSNPAPTPACSLTDVVVVGTAGMTLKCWLMPGDNDTGNKGTGLALLNSYPAGTGYVASSGTWQLAGKSDGLNPFTGMVDVKASSGVATFTTPITGLFGISVKAGNGYAMYLLQGNPANGISWSTAALGNKDVSHISLWTESAPITSNVVPEPSTYVLMAAGLAGLIAVRRRRAA